MPAGQLEHSHGSFPTLYDCSAVFNATLLTQREVVLSLLEEKIKRRKKGGSRRRSAAAILFSFPRSQNGNTGAARV